MSQPNLSNLLQQAQALQEKLKQLQEEAASKTVEAQSGGGMIKVTVDGSMQVRRIEIDPSLLASEDKAMLEDLITVAVNEGLRRAQSLVAEEMGKLAPMGGFKFPGFE
ncbi:MAG TPA: YbaB/EbfC family nucleoid-associated protein [Candidatus Binataceae bacterium]|nr:YbaB/EbfC family nucleoid-associated protein [Candidatus Binataceae bacterium]